MAAMEQLAYKPSRAAQSMRSRRTRQLEDHHIVVFTHHDPDPGPVFRDLIARRGVDGFILDESSVDDPRVRLLAAEGIPFACFGRTAADLPQQWVDVDMSPGCWSWSSTWWQPGTVTTRTSARPVASTGSVSGWTGCGGDWLGVA